MRLIKKFIFFIILIVIIATIGFGVYGYNYYKQTIEKVPLESKITEIRNDYTYIKKEDLPKMYLDAVVAIEDRRFYDHGPVDPIGILRALFVNIKNKELREGGSTITQQVAKNIYFIEGSGTIKRKVAEIFTSIQLEEEYKKEEILEIYVNTIYFGNGYYGIKEACNGYLKKEPKDMTLAELSMLAGVPNAPSIYAPTENKELCKQRQNQVLSAMVTEGLITNEEKDKVDQSFIESI